ncbi:MAG: hypothetical protein J7K65_07910, partial [Planctomycetes bacterium]|nr:hypothetical protein [Planctomycetota bacterium]
RCKLDSKWIKPEQMDGQQPEQVDGYNPNNCSLLPEQTDDLLEIDKKENIKQMPPPLPTLGQAKAFNKTTKGTPLTPEQTKQRQQKMIQDLYEDEK